MIGSRWHNKHTDSSKYLAYINIEMPVPCKSTLLKTILYSDSLDLHQIIPKLSYIFKGYLPVPLRFFYKFFDTFPADIDLFIKAGIPSITTFCNNKNQHSIGDTIEKINMNSYISTLRILEKTIRLISEKLK